MTEAASSPVTFPTARESRFDPPSVLVRWAQENPIRPMTYADGHEGWLVTGFALARAVLADPRFSNLPDRVHSPISRTWPSGGGSGGPDSSWGWIRPNTPATGGC